MASQGRHAGPHYPEHILRSGEGVTAGGALDLFLISRSEATRLILEDALARPAFKSRHFERWLVQPQDLVMLYHYDAHGKPAFSIVNSKLGDALDFDVALDTW